MKCCRLFNNNNLQIQKVLVPDIDLSNDLTDIWNKVQNAIGSGRGWKELALLMRGHSQRMDRNLIKNVTNLANQVEHIGVVIMFVQYFFFIFSKILNLGSLSIF